MLCPYPGRPRWHFLQTSRVLNGCLGDTLHSWKRESGYVGVVPNRTMLGDVVAIEQGGPAPLALQRSVERYKALIPVTECYVYYSMSKGG